MVTTVKFWPIEDVPNSRALLLVILMLFAPVFKTITGPVNKLLLVNVIGAKPTLKLELPPIFNTPVWVIDALLAAVVDADRFPPIMEAAKTKLILLLILTLFGPVVDNVTGPVKLLLLLVKVIPAAPDVKLDVPGTASPAICVIALSKVAIIKFWPTETVPNINPVTAVFFRDTVFEPELNKLTVPVNTLLLVNVMGAAPEVKVDVPGTVNAPICVIAKPLANTIKFWPTEETPKDKALLLVIVTLLGPVLEKLTAPVNKLLLVNEIGAAPAVKFDAPLTVNTPS